MGGVGDVFCLTERRVVFSGKEESEVLSEPLRSCLNCSATLTVWVNREDVWCFEWQRQVKFWLSREVMF